MVKYNFIIAGGEGFYKIAYSDLKEVDYVRYFENYIDGLQGSFTKFAAHINFNLRINRYIKTPLRSIVYDKLFPAEFSYNNPLCFIFFGTQFAVINTSYIEFLKRKYPTAKFVLYMQDILSSLPYYDIDNYKKRFDLILSYDRKDCEKYGLKYFPTPFSYINPSDLQKHEPVDVYFCGAAKTRYNDILNVYNECKRKNLSCRFFITGVPEEARIESDEIIYDKKISYLENLSHAYSSRCILEIMQENAVGFTPRLWEALFYNKHFLTNNKDITKSEYYNKDYIHTLSDIENISDWISVNIQVPKDIIMKKSPRRLLEFIDDNLE